MSAEKSLYFTLLNKLLEGTITPDERTVLDGLAEEDTDKQALLLYLCNKGESNQDLLEAEIIYEKTKRSDANPLPTRSLPKSRFSGTFRLLVGAGVAAAVIIAFLISGWFGDAETFESNIPGKAATFVTEKGERRFFKLNDGTEVWLNNDSRLTVSEGYGVKHRQLALEGEGYFSVAKNKDLPLHINTPGAEIQVIGTIFNLRAYPDEQSIVTSLIEGKVKLKVTGETGDMEYLLNPGDKVEVPNRAFDQPQRIAAPIDQELTEPIAYKKLEIKDEKVLEAMWVENKLVFAADPLPDMVKKMERWFNKTIVVQNDALNDQIFTGVFEEETCEQVLDFLKATGVALTYTVENDTLIIR